MNRFYIAFKETYNEQIYDTKSKVVRWTKSDRKVLDVRINVKKRIHTWIPLKG